MPRFIRVSLEGQKSDSKKPEMGRDCHQIESDAFLGLPGHGENDSETFWIEFKNHSDSHQKLEKTRHCLVYRSFLSNHKLTIENVYFID